MIAATSVVGWAGTQGGDDAVPRTQSDRRVDRQVPGHSLAQGFALLQMAEAAEMDRGKVQLDSVQLGTLMDSGAPDIHGAEAAFLQGYRDFGGRPEWARHFIDDVLPCESSVWGGWYDNGYVSRAQFHPASWRRSVDATGLSDPRNPYHVGGNVAWWSNAIEHPGGSGGWPVCFWAGGWVEP